MSVRMTAAVVVKDPDEVLDFTFDWVDELGTDTISTSTWTAGAGITVDSSSNTTTKATIILSGGTAGKDYMVTNRITTASAKTHERSLHVKVLSR